MSAVNRTSTLDDRLANWGRSNRGAFDANDAVRLTRAWRTLMPHHREILRMVYLWHANREVVCRRLRITRHPPHLFELELAMARSALARALALP
ncbi:hypothetical protein M0D69_15420 [Caballeronia sp. SEWSISQ10-4 2]|uniref:hypothetical protein n=1 Tax=Caballeronia sp. SEWSISQ10-4 2 TaxID=2937438 RepID=UPI00264D030F|nr:hypothetical protein [Caballeronia sp. SEWSISQ10-4 2]MDN7179361.1 hypothetical protein [Caballeronia sp. SEWSISQ10-4 2]